MTTDRAKSEEVIKILKSPDLTISKFKDLVLRNNERLHYRGWHGLVSVVVSPSKIDLFEIPWGHPILDDQYAAEGFFCKHKGRYNSVGENDKQELRNIALTICHRVLRVTPSALDEEAKGNLVDAVVAYGSRIQVFPPEEPYEGDSFEMALYTCKDMFFTLLVH